MALNLDTLPPEVQLKIYERVFEPWSLDIGSAKDMFEMEDVNLLKASEPQDPQGPPGFNLLLVNRTIHPIASKAAQRACTGHLYTEDVLYFHDAYPLQQWFCKIDSIHYVWINEIFGMQHDPQSLNAARAIPKRFLDLFPRLKHLDCMTYDETEETGQFAFDGLLVRSTNRFQGSSGLIEDTDAGVGQLLPSIAFIDQHGLYRPNQQFANLTVDIRSLEVAYDRTSRRGCAVGFIVRYTPHAAPKLNAKAFWIGDRIFEFWQEGMPDAVAFYINSNASYNEMVAMFRDRMPKSLQWVIPYEIRNSCSSRSM